MHAFRVPDVVWDRLQQTAQANGTDRSAVLRALIAWYLRDPPDAKLPKRP